MRPWPASWPASIERVLGVIAHPDDEVFFAGMLDAAARGGAAAVIACATRGEAGRLRGRRAAHDEVAATRTAELEASSAALGAGEPRFLGMSDGAVGLGDGDAVALDAILNQCRPDLVLSCDADGVYGHRDHLALHDMLAERAPATRWRWLRIAFPRHLFDDFGAALQRARPDLFAHTAPTLGRAATAIDWSLELDATAQAAKRAAIAAHASQLGPGAVFLFRGLVPEIVASEWYVE